MYAATEGGARGRAGEGGVSIDKRLRVIAERQGGIYVLSDVIRTKNAIIRTGCASKRPSSDSS